MVETDATECYYCLWVTDNLQTCMNHAVEAHGEILKVKASLCFEQELLSLIKTGSKIGNVLTGLNNC